MNLNEKTVKENVVYKGKIVTLRVDEAELPNKKIVNREFMVHPGGVTIAALTDQDELLFVRQFRYPYGKVILEIPAGKLEPGEDPLAAGKRELQEETGVSAEHYMSLGLQYPSPGYCNEILHLYLATGLSYGKMNPDDDEFLTLEKIPLERAVDMVMCGEIPDGKSQTIILKIYILRKFGKI